MPSRFTLSRLALVTVAACASPVAAPAVARAPAGHAASPASDAGPTSSTDPDAGDKEPAAQPASVDVRGLVVDGDGAPVANAPVVVSVDGADEAPPAAVAADGAGRFSLSLDPGRPYLAAVATAAGHAEARVPASGPTTEEPIELRLRLAARDDAVEVQVVDDRGLPRPEQLVYLTASAPPGWTWAARTDADGRARVAVPGEGIAWVDGVKVEVAPATYRVGAVGPATVVAASRDALDRAPPPAVAAWLASAAVNVERIAPARWVSVFDGADVVGLGASSPGVREFFALRHRLTRAILERGDARAVVWDAPWGAMLALDRYVRTGEGDPAAALAAMGWWAWDVREALVFIDWLRWFNNRRPPRRRVHLVGTGANKTRLETDHVLAAVRDCAPQHGAATERSLAPLRDPRPKTEALILDAEGRERYRRALDDTRALLDTRRVRRCLGPARRALVALSVLALDGAAAGRAADLESGPLAGQATRERAAADVVADVAARLGGAVLWAPNDRVGRGAVDGSPSLGRALADALGPRYRPVAMLFGAGQLRAYDRRPGQPGTAVASLDIRASARASLSIALAASLATSLATPPAPERADGPRSAAPASAPAEAGRAPSSPALIDLRAAPAGPVRDFLARTHRLRHFGGAYDGIDSFTLVTPQNAFDAVVFTPVASPTRPTATGARP